MVYVTGRIASDITFTRNGKQRITFELDGDYRTIYDELNGKELDIDAKEHKVKRSLDANAYFWVMADKLAAKVGAPKEKIYRSYIKEIGGNSDTVCVTNKAVIRLCEGWGRQGIGWVTDTFPSKVNGCTNVILYYGSSTYDTEQMKRLIDMLVFDCKENGIEVMSERERSLLLDKWDAKHS